MTNTEKMRFLEIIRKLKNVVENKDPDNYYTDDFQELLDLADIQFNRDYWYSEIIWK